MAVGPIAGAAKVVVAGTTRVVKGELSMETKKLSNLVIDFFRNDIVWLVFYVAFAATVVERSITWLFFSILQEA